MTAVTDTLTETLAERIARESALRPPVPADITVDSAEFQRLQKRLAAATILLPFAFTLLAVALLFYRPLTWIDGALLGVM